MALTADDRFARGTVFRELHDGPAFVMPNAWDAGSARVLASLGFPALATTSAGIAFGLGRRDGAGLVSRDEALENARALVGATALPVSADLEDCYATDVAGIADTVRAAADAGLSGGSIEDASGDPQVGIRPIDEAVERVAAAAAAVRELPYPFTLTARAENFLHGVADIDDTITRLRAFADAGADVLFAPGLPDLAAVGAVCRAVDKPVSFMAGVPGCSWTVAELADQGVTRISVGPALALAAYGGLCRAAEEIAGSGSFGFVADSPGFGDIATLMAERLP